jgi:hypothetical protein
LLTHLLLDSTNKNGEGKLVNMCTTIFRLEQARNIFSYYSISLLSDDFDIYCFLPFCFWIWYGLFNTTSSTVITELFSWCLPLSFHILSPYLRTWSLKGSHALNLLSWSVWIFIMLGYCRFSLILIMNLIVIRNTSGNFLILHTHFSLSSLHKKNKFSPW